jgi:hypothetical protein
MPAITLTLAHLDALHPCSSRRSAAVAKIGAWDAPITAAQAAAAGIDLSDLVWVASSLAIEDKDVERRSPTCPVHGRDPNQARDMREVAA